MRSVGPLPGGYMREIQGIWETFSPTCQVNRRLKSPILQGICASAAELTYEKVLNNVGSHTHTHSLIRTQNPAEEAMFLSELHWGAWKWHGAM